MPRFGNINANILQVSVLLRVSAYTVTIKALSVLVNCIPAIIVANVLNVWHTICTFHTGISTYLSSDIMQCQCVELLAYNMYISYRYIDLPEQ